MSIELQVSIVACATIGGLKLVGSQYVTIGYDCPSFS
jgi:hypothetical protein